MSNLQSRRSRATSARPARRARGPSLARTRSRSGAGRGIASMTWTTCPRGRCGGTATPFENGGGVSLLSCVVRLRRECRTKQKGQVSKRLICGSRPPRETRASIVRLENGRFTAAAGWARCLRPRFEHGQNAMFTLVCCRRRRRRRAFPKTILRAQKTG